MLTDDQPTNAEVLQELRLLHEEIKEWKEELKRWTQTASAFSDQAGKLQELANVILATRA